MKCVRCGVANISSVDYCQGCKAPLRFRRRSDRYSKRKIWITSTIIIVWAFCFTYYFKNTLFGLDSKTSITVAKQQREQDRDADRRQELLKKLQKKRMDTTDLPLAESISPTPVKSEQLNTSVQNSAEGREIFSGTLTIIDPWNKQIASLRSAIFAGGWLVLPTRACLAGAKWQFVGDSGENTLLLGGKWKEGDSVGLWQVSPTFVIENLVKVGSWNQNSPLKWLSLESLRQEEDLLPISIGTRGDFTTASLPDTINEIGVLIQDGNVVGWTFGQWLTGAYLWEKGDIQTAIHPEISVDDFYNTTFAGGREEMFSMAIEGNYLSLERLDLILAGYNLPPKLTLEDTPYSLRSDFVNNKLIDFVHQLVADGKEALIIRKIDSAVLESIGDINFFMDILNSIVRVSGYEVAISAIESTGSAIVQALGVDVPVLNEKHLSLYQDWLQTLITSGDVQESQKVYSKVSSYYGDDPYVYLLGVELEIMTGNWQEAEKRLYQRNYPPELLDRFKVLARKISDLKGQEGKIIVTFTPGTGRIPLVATINGSSERKFLVDTGASMVTIPSTMVDDLGLEIIDGDHYTSRQIFTAGGVISANEVIIGSLEISGWIEYDIKALVVDIPEQPEIGLIGLNYLNRFKMNLNNDQGTLILTPN